MVERARREGWVPGDGWSEEASSFCRGTRRVSVQGVVSVKERTPGLVKLDVTGVCQDKRLMNMCTE